MRLYITGLATVLATVLVMVLLPTTQALPGTFSCSIQTIADEWVFATGVGEIALIPGVDPTGITAIGTMNIDKQGNVSGKFDNTVARLVFVPNTTYSGTVIVNPDCTGTLSFTTSGGAMRTDSIAILGNGSEIWGMSQDPLNLWTYTVKRISGRR